jgi:hypothetical protein
MGAWCTMNSRWLVAVAALIACVSILGLRVLIRRARIRRAARLRGARVMRGRVGAFNAAAWPDGTGVMPRRDLQRPADIELTDPRILPPPRHIDGRYGE